MTDAAKRRNRVKTRIRRRIRGSLERPRLTVFKSDKHMYAQLICDDSGTTLATASTLEKDVQAKVTGSKKTVSAAKVVGQIIASRAKAKKIETVVFDRNGYIYSGRVSALADGAREGGLKF